MTALSLFGRVPPTKHYYEVGVLRRRMTLIDREHIDADIDYWRGVVAALHGQQALRYNSLQLFHALEVVRKPLDEVDRANDAPDADTLSEVKMVCSIMCRE